MFIPYIQLTFWNVLPMHSAHERRLGAMSVSVRRTLFVMHSAHERRLGVQEMPQDQLFGAMHSAHERRLGVYEITGIRV